MDSADFTFQLGSSSETCPFASISLVPRLIRTSSALIVVGWRLISTLPFASIWVPPLPKERLSADTSISLVSDGASERTACPQEGAPHRIATMGKTAWMEKLFLKLIV